MYVVSIIYTEEEMVEGSGLVPVTASSMCSSSPVTSQVGPSEARLSDDHISTCSRIRRSTDSTVNTNC